MSINPYDEIIEKENILEDINQAPPTMQPILPAGPTSPVVTPPAPRAPETPPAPEGPENKASPFDVSAPKEQRNPYDEIVAKDVGMAKMAGVRTYEAAADEDTDRMARATKFSEKYKVPAEFAYNNLEKFEETDKRNVDRGVIESNPNLSAFLANKENAILAKGDLENLQLIGDKAYRLNLKKDESLFTEYGRAGRTGLYNLQSSMGHVRAIYGMGSVDELAESIAESNRRAQALSAKSPDYYREFRNNFETQYEHVSGAWDKTLSGARDVRNGKILSGLADFASGAVQTPAELVDLIGSTVVRTKGLGYSTTENMANMLPSLVAGAAGAKIGAVAGTAVAPGVGSVAGGIGGFAAATGAGALPVEIGAWTNQALIERGYDVTKAEDLKRAYGNAKLMAEIRGEAERKGLTTAAVETATSLVAGRFFSRVGKGAKLTSKAGAAAKDVTVEVAGETGGEFLGEAAAREDLSKADFANALFEGIASIGQSGVTAATGAAARGAMSIRKRLPKDTTDAAEEMARQTSDAMEAIDGLNEASELIGKAGESKLGERSPGKIKDFIDTFGGDEPAAVYMQASDFDDFFSSRGDSPLKAAADLMKDDGAAYLSTKETTGVLEVPLSELAEGVSRDGNLADILEIARTKPDGMTFTEAREVIEALPGTMAELAKEAETYVPPDQDGFDQEAVGIARDIEQQIVDTGKFKRRDARLYSEVYKSFFGTMAKRMGTSPQKLFERYGISIKKGDAPTEGGLNQSTEQGPAQQVDGGVDTSERDFTSRPETDQTQQEGPQDPGTLSDISEQTQTTDEAVLNQIDRKSNERRQAEFTLPETVRYATFENKANVKGNIQNPVKLRQSLGKVIKGTYKNEHTGQEIEIDQRSIEKIMTRAEEKFDALEKRGSQKRAKTVFQNDVRATANLPEILKSAVYYFDRPSPIKGENPTKVFFSTFTMNGQDYVGKIDVQDGKVVSFESVINEKAGGVTMGGDKATEATVLPPDEMSITQFETRINNAREQFKYFQTDREGTPRGQIILGKNNKFTISLLEGANKSTFLHESGHLFLEILKDMSNMEGAPEQVRQDFEAVKDWLGAKDGNFKVEQHEQFARGFEAYLMEGKAPSPSLRKAFASFRVWLTSIYRKLRNLDVDLPQDVRNVFDRLLAVDDTLNDAEIPALFPEPENMGLTPTQAQKYREAMADARASAEETLTTQIMEAELRKQTKGWQRDFKHEKANVANDLPPIYKTIEQMKETGIKLTKDELSRFYTKDFVENSLRRHGVLTTSDKATPVSAAASMLGYDSAEQLIDALGAAPKKDEYIELEATRRQLKKYPDLLVNGKLEQEAKNAVHKQSRSKLLRLELEFIAGQRVPELKKTMRMLGKKIPPDKAVKKQAKQTLYGYKTRDIRPYKFERMERKYARMAAEAVAKGDFQAAFDAKVRELLNHEMYREARRMDDFITKNKGRFKKIFKSDKDLAKSRNMDLVNAARSVVAAYGLGKADKGPGEYLEALRKYDPDAAVVIEDMIETAMDSAGDHKEVSFQDFEFMANTVNALWEHSKAAKEIEIDGKKKDVEGAVDDLIGQLNKRKGIREGKAKDLQEFKEEYARNATKWDKTINQLLGVKALVRKIEHWIDAMDLGDVKGFFRSYIFTPVSEATDRFNLEKKNYLQRLDDIVKDLSLDTGPIVSHDLKFQFKDKGEVLGALLHRGNQSNFRKLLVGRDWGTYDKDTNTLDTSRFDAFEKDMIERGILTKQDYDAIQALWDLNEEIKPMAQRAHKKIMGFFFNEITANSFTNQFGTYRGGYAPAAIDPDAVIDIARKQELEQFIEEHPGHTWPAAGGDGFTKSREASFNKPLALDLRLVPRHIDAALRFAIIKPAVIDAAKVVTNPRFRQAMGEIDPVVIDKMIIPALNRADKNEIYTKGPHSNSLLASMGRALKLNSSMQLMFMNIRNIIEQASGFGVAATRVGPASVAKGILRHMRNPRETAEFIAQKSVSQATRQDEQIYELQRSAHEIMDEKSKFKKMQDWASRHAYVGQVFFQNIIDNSVWIASYDESIAKGLDEKSAIRKADADIRMTQSSRRPLDIANVESNEMLGFFQMFMSFFNMIANLNISNFHKLVYEDIGISKKLGKGAYLYMMGFAQVAIISEALKKLAAGGLDEDEDGEIVDDLMGVLLGSQVDLALAMIPVGGQAINAGINRANDKFYDDRMSVSPAVEALSVVTGFVATAPDLVYEEGGEKKKVRDSLTALGILTGLPLRPISKPISYQIDRNTGKARPDNLADASRGYITGKPGTK